MMQPVAILLIAVSAGANPWDAPQTAAHAVAGQARVDTPWEATPDDHQYQLDRTARRKTKPVAPAPMNQLPHRNPYRGVQPATNGGAAEADPNVSLAQYVEGHAWPTASNATPRDVGRDVNGGNPRAPQLATPNYLDARPAARQPQSYDQQADTDFVLPSAENRVPATLDDPYRLDRSDETRRYPPNSQNAKPLAADPAAGIRPTTRRAADVNPSDVFDPRGGSYRQPAYDRTRNPTGPSAMPDPYAMTHQNEAANSQQPPLRPKPEFSRPIQSPRIAENSNASANVSTPPVLTSKFDTAAVTTPPTSNTTDMSPDAGETSEVVPSLPGTDPNTYTRGGGTLLLLAFFASVGLNFYLGWIAWDTYNRYQDMVSDIRYSNTSARRERVDRERDVVDRRTGDRHLVDSAAY